MEDIPKIVPTACICSEDLRSQDSIPSNSRKRHLIRNATPSMNLPIHDNIHKLTIFQVPEQNEGIGGPLIWKKNSTVYSDVVEKSAGSSNEENETEQIVNIDNVRINDKSEDDDDDEDDDHKRMMNKEIEQFENEEHIEMLDEQFDDDDDDETINMKNEQFETEESLEIIVEHSNDVNVPKNFKDAAVQVQSDSLTFKFTSLLTTEDALSTMTGIPSFGILKAIQKLVGMKKNLISHQNCKLDELECILLAFMKLKQNLSYEALAVIFQKCNSGTCELIFLEMIDILYVSLKLAVKWPPKQIILLNMPKCFHDFPNVRVVVDCIEIVVETPSNICCRTSAYSHYKGDYTIKFMTGVTPAGFISFVSEAYSGCSSKDYIFESSGILELLEDNDAVMADQGFTVSALCEKNNITLITPPFTKNRKQLSACDAALGHSISAARVHIELVNQRIKTFQILNNKLPTDLILEADKIFRIACAIVNLSAPVLSIDKF